MNSFSKEKTKKEIKKMETKKKELYGNKTSFELWRETEHGKECIGSYTSLEKAEKDLLIFKYKFGYGVSKYTIQKVNFKITYEEIETETFTSYEFIYRDLVNELKEFSVDAYSFSEAKMFLETWIENGEVEKKVLQNCFRVDVYENSPNEIKLVDQFPFFYSEQPEYQKNK